MMLPQDLAAGGVEGIGCSVIGADVGNIVARDDGFIVPSGIRRRRAAIAGLGSVAGANWYVTD